MELVGSFTSRAAAEVAAKAEVQAQASKIPGARSMNTNLEGTFCGAVTQDGRIKRIVQVVCESGEMDMSLVYVEEESL